MSTTQMSSVMERIQQLRNSGLLSAEETSAVIQTTYPTLKSSSVAHMVLAVFDEQATGPSMLDIVSENDKLKKIMLETIQESKQRPIILQPIQEPQEIQEIQDPQESQVHSEESKDERKKRKAREYYQKNKEKILAKARAKKQVEERHVQFSDVVSYSPVPALLEESQELTM